MPKFTQLEIEYLEEAKTKEKLDTTRKNVDKKQKQKYTRRKKLQEVPIQKIDIPKKDASFKKEVRELFTEVTKPLEIQPINEVVKSSVAKENTSPTKEPTKKPKRKYTRKVFLEKPPEKPKRKYTRKVFLEKPPEKPKRKYTRKQPMETNIKLSPQSPINMLQEIGRAHV